MIPFIAIGLIGVLHAQTGSVDLKSALSSPYEKQADMMLDIYENSIPCDSGVGCMVDCETCRSMLMDNIISYVRSSIKYVNDQTFTDLCADNRFEMEVYPLDPNLASQHRSTAKDRSAIYFKPDGSYYIELGVYASEKGKTYGFTYDGLFFYTSTYLRGFFSSVNGLVYYERLSQDPDLDEPDYFGDWRFVIKDGEITEAVMITSHEDYDLMNGYEIPDDFLSRLPMEYRTGNCQNSSTPRLRSQY